MVGQWTLDPPVEVRVLPSQPKEGVSPLFTLSGQLKGSLNL